MATTRLRDALIELHPEVDSSENNQIADVVGNKSDTVDGDSIVALIKYVEQLAVSIKDATDHLEDETSQGLNASFHSIAYRLGEIASHIHSIEQWYGRDTGDNLLNRNSLSSWQLIAGISQAYGAEVQLSDGTEIESGDLTMKFDLSEVLITDNNAGSASTTYKVQFWYGTGTFAAATLLTEGVCNFFAAADNHGVITLRSPRVSCNNKLWARVACSVNSKTINFILGVHTYFK